MRVAVLILILANLAVFVWLRWAHSPTPAPDLTPVTPSGKPLTLLPAALSASREKAHAGVPSSCLRFGPIASASAASRLAARLDATGYPVHAFVRSERVPGDYRVVLGGFPDNDAANRAVAKLRGGGVTDLFLRKGTDAQGPSLSLGVFRDRDHALRRAARIRALGFEPRIHAIVHRQTGRYLEAELPAAASASAALRAAEVTREPRRAACTAASAGSIIAPAPASLPVP